MVPAVTGCECDGSWFGKTVTSSAPPVWAIPKGVPPGPVPVLTGNRAFRFGSAKVS